MSKIIMFQGVGANAGKTVFTRSLCRYLSNNGKSVAPFKPVSVGNANQMECSEENLILDSRIKILNEAARNKLSKYHSPIQIFKEKGQGNIGRLFIGQEEHGKVEIYAKDIALLHQLPKNKITQIKNTIKQYYQELEKQYEYIILEGAGSPIDLLENDYANYFPAALTGAPIVLIGSVSTGGFLASLLGTFELFPESLKRNLIGFALNDVGFGSNISVLQSQSFSRKTGLSNLGFFPHCSIYDDIPEGETSSLKNAEEEYDYLSDMFEKNMKLDQLLAQLEKNNVRIGEKLNE